MAILAVVPDLFFWSIIDWSLCDCVNTDLAFKANGLKTIMGRRGSCHDNASAQAFVVCLKKNALCVVFSGQEKLHKMMSLIILSCFTIQNDAMVTTETCHPWSLRRNTLRTKWVPKNFGGVSRRAKIQSSTPPFKPLNGNSQTR